MLENLNIYVQIYFKHTLPKLLAWNSTKWCRNWKQSGQCYYTVVFLISQNGDYHSMLLQVYNFGINYLFLDYLIALWTTSWFEVVSTDLGKECNKPKREPLVEIKTALFRLTVLMNHFLQPKSQGH